jgi:hypothetical protein
MKIDYAKHPVTGIQALEEGLVELGRAKDVPWLIDQIETLGEEELVRRFIPWPGLTEPEGVWGAISIVPYAIMCQLDMPTERERKLGAEPKLKVDLASTPEHILERLRELG